MKSIGEKYFSNKTASLRLLFEYFSLQLSHMIPINHIANRKRIVYMALTILNNVEIKVFADRIFYFILRFPPALSVPSSQSEANWLQNRKTIPPISDVMCVESGSEMSTLVKNTTFSLYKFHKSCENIFNSKNCRKIRPQNQCLFRSFLFS